MGAFAQGSERRCRGAPVKDEVLKGRTQSVSEEAVQHTVADSVGTGDEGARRRPTLSWDKIGARRYSSEGILKLPNTGFLASQRSTSSNLLLSKAT